MSKSKYYDLDAYYRNYATQRGWSKEDFTKAVLILESLPRRKLLLIANHPDISLEFTGGGEVSNEELISALLTDYRAKVITSVLNEFGIWKKESPDT